MAVTAAALVLLVSAASTIHAAPTASTSSPASNAAPHPLDLAASDIYYRIWTVEDGLPTGSVTSLAQTPDGYLWIATLDGLVRFDGVRMQVLNRSEIPEMTSNRCRTIYVDTQGTLWVSTEEGSVLRMRNGRLTNFGADSGLPAGIIALAGPVEEGGTWAITDQGAYQLQSERWARPPASISLPRELTNPPVRVREGLLQVWERGRYLDYLPPAGSSWEGVLFLLQDADGATWVAHGGGPSLRLIGGQISVAGPAISGDPVRLSLGRFWCRGAGGRIWALEGGILHVRENGAWHTFAKPVPEIVDPQPRMFEDKEGTLWIGGDRGLTQAIPTAVRVLTPVSSFYSQNIYSLAMDPDGRVWVTTQGDPFLYERGTFTRLTGLPWWPGEWIRGIEPDGEGTVLAGGPNGLYRVWPGRKLERIGSAMGFTHDFLRDRRGRLWIAAETGLFRQDGTDWKRFGQAEGMPPEIGRALLESRDGGIWVGTYGGLVRIDGDAIRTWRQSDGLSSDKVRSLYEDAAGVLWVGTYDSGIVRFDGKRFVGIRKRDGLYDDGVFAILDDGEGNFWMSSNRGVSCVAKSELESFAAGTLRRVSVRAWKGADGMASSECNGGRQPSGMRAPDGTLWFPTQKGIAVIDPRAVRVNTVPPRVVIEDVTTDRRAIPRDAPVELAPGERRLEVRYTAATFVRPDGARFRHRLIGFDPEWIEDGPRRFAQYALVPPGDYELRIMAANSDGIWSREGASLPIRVLPHWWQTAWVRWGSFLGGIAVIGFVYAARVSQLKRRRANQDAFARRLIESQEAERKRIAGELHDGIGQTLMVIRNRALLGLRDGGSGDSEEDPVSDISGGSGVASTRDPGSASRMLRQMSEISEAAAEGIEEVRKVAYGLRPYQLDRLGLKRALEAVIEQAAAASGIPILSTIGEVDGAFRKDDEINVYRIVQEAVSNLVHHARAGSGRVVASVRDREVEILIEDDGVGFDSTSLAATGGGGLGLSGIAERARILGGRCTVRSAPGQGTQVTVILPRTAPGQGGQVPRHPGGEGDVTP